MSTKKTFIALSTAIAVGILAAGSAAQANEPTDEYGGSKIGPLGQTFGTPAQWGADRAPRGAYAYGFVAPSQAHQPVHKHTQSRRAIGRSSGSMKAPGTNPPGAFRGPSGQ